LPFLAYLIVGLLRCPDQIKLRAQRLISVSDVEVGEPFKVQVQIENPGPALTNLTLSDSVEPAIMVTEGQIQQQFTLGHGKIAQIEYVARGIRALYRWTHVSAKASDPCGLFEVRNKIPAPGELLVRPAATKFRRVRLAPHSTLHAPGPTAAHFPGSGSDFWGVREYRAGDPLRRLNWRLAGRYPRRLFTNEFQGEEIADYGLILDARRLTNSQKVDEALFERCISAATSLAEGFLTQGNRVALLVFGEAPIGLFPGYGKRQLNQVLQALARASLSRHLPARYLEYFPARLFPSRSVLLMFSVVDADDLETYRRLRSFGYEVLLISPDPIEYASRELEANPLNNLAVRAARLERVVQLKALMQMGISVINWQVDEPLDTRLQQAARDMAHRRSL
jgi:uncharacterized protein (DUF58 family)